MRSIGTHNGVAPVLEWEYADRDNVLHTSNTLCATIVWRKESWGPNGTQRRAVRAAPFAYIRSVGYNPDGLLFTTGKYLVTSTSFDAMREFDSIEDAKTYVESIFAMETT
jgi:hypothetical protein